MFNFTLTPAWRVWRDCRWRALRKLAVNLVWRGRGAVNAFERRQKALRAGRKDAAFFPAFTMFSVTDRCQLSCRGCWVRPAEPPRELTLEQVSGAMETCRRHGTYFAGLLGGEPLLWNPLLPLLDRFPDCYFQIFTNGQAATPDFARELARRGNVTPVVSIEGLADETRRRRGADGVFDRSAAAVGLFRDAGLFTGVAASIGRRNFGELVDRAFLDQAAGLGAHYLWYYIYRPAGPLPDEDDVLDAEQIVALRRFLVERRCDAPLFLIDAYWDDRGRALCPAAAGLSHHVSPGGELEFCPPLQWARERLDADGGDLGPAFADSAFLARLRALAAAESRGCVILENPGKLLDFLRSEGAVDSSGRGAAEAELARRRPQAGHHIPGAEIPEKNPLYAWAKKHYFFGFGAYG